MARATCTAIASLVLLTTVGPRASAQVVVDGGAPNGATGWNIYDDNRAATSFTIGSTISFDDIRFWGILPDVPVYTPTIYWEILDQSVSGLPGTVVLSGNASATGVFRAAIIAGLSSYQFDVAAGAQSLGPGSYWLALHDGPVDASGFTGSTLLWESTDAGQYTLQTFTVTDDWDPIADEGLAFQLRNSSVAVTPEPSTIVLAATGLLGIAGVRRRRRSPPMS